MEYSAEEKGWIQTLYDFLSHTLGHTHLFFGEAWSSYREDWKSEADMKTTEMDYCITFCANTYNREIQTHRRNIVFLSDAQRGKEGLLCFTEPPGDWNELLHTMYKRKKPKFTVLQSMSKTEEVESMKQNIEKFDIEYSFVDTDNIVPIPNTHTEWNDVIWKMENDIYYAFSDFLQKEEDILILFFGKIALTYQVHTTLQYIHQNIDTQRWMKIGDIGWVLCREVVEKIVNSVDHNQRIVSQLEQLFPSK
jgi:hypothetical protein